MEVKRCCRCKEEKPFEAFNHCAARPFGLHNHCRVCQKEVRHAWYEKHKEREKQKSRNQPYDREAVRRRYLENKDVLLARNRERRRTPQARAKANKTRAERRATDASFRIGTCIRARMRRALLQQETVRSSATLFLLGCSLAQLKKHLENRFTSGMSWDNYGYYGWHIDHVRPCASFDLTIEAERKECFHFSNLQPLWRVANQSKKDRVA